jgi:hypothetical protein
MRIRELQREILIVNDVDIASLVGFYLEISLFLEHERVFRNLRHMDRRFSLKMSVNNPSGSGNIMVNLDTKEVERETSILR